MKKEILVVIFSGFLVGLVLSDCSRSNCKNGGTCQPINGGYNWGYHCICSPGFYGEQCQWDNPSNCSNPTSTPCQNGGICIAKNENERICECPGISKNWIKFGGHYCEINDPCKTCPGGTVSCHGVPTLSEGRICLDIKGVAIKNPSNFFA